MDLEEDYDAPLGAPTEGSSSAAPPQSAPQTETRLPLGMEFDNRSLAERASHMAINRAHFASPALRMAPSNAALQRCPSKESLSMPCYGRFVFAYSILRIIETKQICLSRT